MLKGGWWWKSCGRGLNGLYLEDPQDLTARQGKFHKTTIREGNVERTTFCFRNCVVPVERMGLFAQAVPDDDSTQDDSLRGERGRLKVNESSVNDSPSAHLPTHTKISSERPVQPFKSHITNLINRNVTLNKIIYFLPYCSYPRPSGQEVEPTKDRRQSSLSAPIFTKDSSKTRQFKKNSKKN